MLLILLVAFAIVCLMDMKFKTYWLDLLPENKKSLADDLNTSVAYLSQIAHGHRNAGANILLNIEAVTKGEITPMEIRPIQAA